MENGEKQKPLSWREYLGAMPQVPSGRRSEPGEPLTIREYLGAMPNIFQMGEMLGDAFRGAQRFLSRLRN